MSGTGTVRIGGDVLCLAHGKPAQRYRLKYPQPDSTPRVMRWEPPGPPLWMCDECRPGSEEWAEEDS